MTESNDIAVVSLDQPLENIADELGRSFSEYGFAWCATTGFRRS